MTTAQEDRADARIAEIHVEADRLLSEGKLTRGKLEAFIDEVDKLAAPKLGASETLHELVDQIEINEFERASGSR